MKKRWIGFAVWLLLAACLYFFENNTGTRTVFACSMLFPLVPALRGVFFAADEADREEAPEPSTIRAFAPREAEEPGDVRQYRPGDPVRRVHWKLSAKKDELLVREAEREPAAEELPAASPEDGRAKPIRKRPVWPVACLIALCAALLLLIPEARRGAQALCNGVFAASEKTNAYAYEYFPVPEDQSVAFAAALLAVALAALLSLMALTRGRMAALGTMAACTLFQAYFGLPFPAAVNIPLYGLLALRTIKRPASREGMLSAAAAVLLAALLVTLLFPGVDAATEAASEAVRDRLSQAARRIAGEEPESPEGETRVRRAHTQSLRSGENKARADREYRLATVEEEQISMPRWIDWLKIILLLSLSVALVSLPFAPFLLLNARRERARKDRERFASENVGEAVRAIFRWVVIWLDETGHGAGNLPYRDWAEKLPDGYADRFARCAEDFEEAAYSRHVLPEEKRLRALSLLEETRAALWRTAGWKQRFRLKYWMCLCE